jgi:hypothetical protein
MEELMSRKRKYSTETPVIGLGVVTEDIVIEDMPENVVDIVDEPTAQLTVAAKVIFVKRDSVTFEIENHYFEKRVSEAAQKFKKGDTINILCEGTIGNPDFKISLI